MTATNTNAKIRVIKAKDFVYDVFSEGDDGTSVWLLSTNSPDRVFDFLSKMSRPVISFADKSFGFERKN